MIKCDPITGACLLPEQVKSSDVAVPKEGAGWSVHYVGDPMCSWCWGISPTIEAVETFCEAHGVEFTITMGGLRAGGGDLWNEAFITFLRNEWKHISKTTGQPFGFKLLETPHFNYDTEPACRAVATVKILQSQNNLPKSIVLAFFSALQHKFYVDGQDPKVVDFYVSICANLALDFDEFVNTFNSKEAQQAVQHEFVITRQWGVRSFPTLLIELDGKTATLAEGYTTAEHILSRLQQEIAV